MKLKIVLTVISIITISCKSVDDCDCAKKMKHWKDAGMFIERNEGNEAADCRDNYAKVETHPSWEPQKQINYANDQLDKAIIIAESKCNNQKKNKKNRENGRNGRNGR